MKRLGCMAIVVMFIIILMTGCTKTVKAGDLIVKTDNNSLVKVPEADILSFFEKNRDNLKAVSEYCLNNQGKVFDEYPVLINKEFGISEIQDETIKNLVNTFLQEGKVSLISSSEFEGRDTNFRMDYEYGSYEQGIRYASNKVKIDEDKTVYNYVKEYKDLGNGWFYYIYYYDKIKDEEVFRKNAWDSLSEEAKKTVTCDWSKAAVTLKEWIPMDKTGKVKPKRLDVSVSFSTDQDGLLGPITIYLDPSTKKVAGGAPRL